MMMHSTFRPSSNRTPSVLFQYREFSSIRCQVYTWTPTNFLGPWRKITNHNLTMAAKDGERSASSATRFTATTPHASSKMGTGAATPKSRVPPREGAGGGGRPKKPVSAAATSAGTETPEQRVARLRAAHAAAKNRQVSRFDQILAKSRPFFDSAHRITVMSLVGLTGRSACFSRPHSTTLGGARS